MGASAIKLLCAKEVAERLGVTPRVAAKLLRQQQIKGFKLSGKYWRTTDLHIESFISQSLRSYSSPKRIAA